MALAQVLISLSRVVIKKEIKTFYFDFAPYFNTELDISPLLIIIQRNPLL